MRRIIFLLNVLVICIFLNGCSSSESNEETTQLDYLFLNEFPFEENIYDACDWFDEEGYKYSFDELNESASGETPNGWDFDVSSVYGVEGLVAFWHKGGSSDKCNLIYESCLLELEELYGEPTRSGEDYAWYTDGELVVGLIDFEDTIQVQIGSYNGMDEFL